MATVSIRPATITATGQPILTLTAPFHPECSARAKALGGRWNSTQKQWQFDLRDEERVCEMARALYGTDGRDPAGLELVTIRISFPAGFSVDRGGITIAGRSIAYASGRDSGARLGSGVILIEGQFDGGGSVKNWTTRAPRGTVVEVRDVPRPAAERAIAEIEAAVATTSAALRSDWERAAAKWDSGDHTCACSIAGRAYAGCSRCGGTGEVARPGAPELAAPAYTIEILEGAPTAADIAAHTGQGMAASALEQAWASIQALPIESQVDIRNRLLKAL